MDEASMPTARASAAFKYLVSNNKYYKYYLDEHDNRLAQDKYMTISSFDLFINYKGVECARYPHLYPTTDFTDTGILTHYKDEIEDDSTRVLSIGQSWTRKVLSSIRAYGEQRDLSFFLHEKMMAQKFFAAHTRAQRMGVTADVMARDSQASSGYHR